MTKETKISRKPIPIGTKTKWGKIQAITFSKGERYYMMVGRYGDVALMHADVVETKK
jgi:hypothetical protein